VAKNDDFVAFAKSLAETAATQAPADVAQLAAGKIEERRQQLVQKIGENISIRRFKRLQAKGKLALYLHGSKIGVLVDYEGPEEVGKDLGMHIAFARPLYMSKEEVPQQAVADERRIHEARAKESGKPAEIVAKMVDGAMNKWLGEKTLLGQPFVKDDKQTVEKMLAAKKAKLHAYAFFVVGEGIEKRADDFAAEVMAQAGKAH
jgi:elongation factor Ts